MATQGTRQTTNEAEVIRKVIFSPYGAGQKALRSATTRAVKLRLDRARKNRTPKQHPLWGRTLELASGFATQNLGVTTGPEWGDDPLRSVQISMGTIAEKYLVGIAKDLVRLGFTATEGKLRGYQLVDVRASSDFSDRVRRARRICNEKHLTESTRAELLQEQVAAISLEFFIDENYVRGCIRDNTRASYPDLLTVFANSGHRAMVATELKISGENDVKSVDENIAVLEEIAEHLREQPRRNRQTKVNSIVAIMFAPNKHNAESTWKEATAAVDEAALGAIFGTAPLTPKEYGRVRENLALAAADLIIASKVPPNTYEYDPDKSTVDARWKKLQ